MTFPVETTTLFEERRPSVEGPPLVCVAVSLFNYAGFITECLDSIAAQTHARLELIVVDDHSKDRSADVAAAWLAGRHDRFARTLLVQHVRNQGLSQARNTAFALAEAEQVMVVDADNALYPPAVARLLATLQDTGAGAAYSQIAVFGDAVHPGYAAPWSAERFKPANYVDAMALVSKAAWSAVGGYDHLDLGWEDFDFWCKFVEHGLKGVFVPEVLCRYRLHQSSMLRTETDRKLSRISQRLMARHPWLDL